MSKSIQNENKNVLVPMKSFSIDAETQTPTSTESECNSQFSTLEEHVPLTENNPQISTPLL